MPPLLCSLCSSVVTNPTVPPQLSKKTWKRSKNKISFTNDAASTFCSVFNLPSEEFISLLTDFSAALYCPGCSKCVQELHKTANELVTLQKRLADIKNELEDKFRDKISSIGPDKLLESDDNMVISMLRSYLPCLMVKGEPDHFANTDVPDDVLFPHLVFSEPDDEIGDQSIESQGRRDLKLDPQTGTFDGKSADNFLSRRFKLKVSNRGVKKRKMTIEGGKFTSKKKRRNGSTCKASVGVGGTGDVPILNDAIFKAFEGPQQTPRKRVRIPKLYEHDSQAEAHEKGAGRGHLTPILVEEKQKILKMIADNPTWSLKTIHENGGSMFREWTYKERWQKQIKLYEKKREIASSNVCNRCVLGFKQIRVLRDHFLQLHPPRSEFMCSLCEFPFPNQEDLTNHIVLHECSPKDEFHCLQCGEIFSNSENLKIHTWDHDFRQFKCNAKYICYKVFPSEEYLSKHKCREPPKNFVCELCGKAFELSYKLARHKLSHSDAKTFSCHLCPKTVKYAFSLDTHLKQYHADVIPPSTTISKPRRLNKKSKKLIAQELAAAAGLNSLKSLANATAIASASVPKLVEQTVLNN